MSADEGRELLADTLEGTKTVVLSEGVEEVLEDVSLVGTGDLLELYDDLLLVVRAQGRGVQNFAELVVGLEDSAQVGQGLGGRVESGGLSGSGVLLSIENSSARLLFVFPIAIFLVL